jgi:predicted  nucleic acid-binding Zn-ribbon protein
MTKTQLELLVLYQDLCLMLVESEEKEKKEMGFSVKGKEKLIKAKEELEKNIKVNYIRVYNRLCTRYKRPIVPVQNNICLGCFARLPTSYIVPGRNEEVIFTCEQCGRILYWID